jgi:hypothetical protein
VGALHAPYTQVEAAGKTEDVVKDSLESEDGASSFAEAYVRVVQSRRPTSRK